MKPRLTPREREVLTLLCQGFEYKQVAERMRISPRTVEKLATSMRAHVGATTNAQAIAIAYERGLFVAAPAAEEAIP